MRKTQGSGLRSADRIVLRTERDGESRPSVPVTRTPRTAAEPRKLPAAVARRRRGATMDYQMGFTSGPSH